MSAWRSGAWWAGPCPQASAVSLDPGPGHQRLLGSDGSTELRGGRQPDGHFLKPELQVGRRRAALRDEE